MRHDLIVSGSIIINTGPEKIWEVLTNPELIKEYLFGTETVTDWKEGHEIIFQGVYGENNEHSYRDKGIIQEYLPHRKISYTYWSGFTGLEDKPENYSLVSYDLTPEKEGQTSFTWTQKGFANQDGYQHSKEGMTAFLEQIKTIAER